MKRNLFTPETRKNLVIILSIIAIAWIAYFFHMGRFGLYEDDYWFVGIPGNASFGELWDKMLSYLFNVERNQGRYLAAFIPALLTHVTFTTGGLWMVYFTGLIIVSVNAILVYFLVRKRFPFELSVFTALLFLLYPADTSKAFLVHIYQLQISFAFFLISGLLWFGRFRWLSYIMATSCLLMYESPFLPFILIPLFDELSLKREVLRKYLLHFLIVAGIVFALFALRKFFGEKSVEGLGMADTIKKTAISLFAGPATVLWSFVKAPLDTLAGLGSAIPYIIGSLLVILFLLFHSFHDTLPDLQQQYTDKAECKLLNYHIVINDQFRLGLKGLTVGILMFMTGYLFSITHYPPTTLEGRMTSVHLAGIFGGALTVGAILYMLLLWACSVRAKWIYLLVIGTYFSLLCGYGSLIQKDFAKSWDLQKQLWKQIVKICPDAGENTLIFLKNNRIDSTRFVITHSWAMPMILENLYEYPDTWEMPPKVVLLDEMNTLDMDGDINYLKPAYPFLFNYMDSVPLEQDNIILLEKTDQGIIRYNDTLTIDGEKIPLKTPDGRTLVSPYLPDRLYKFMIAD